ncbi:Hypothetical protein AA314_09958 [Archangium gephyra]|uniref:Uncharacterized protein n=1 Tax=Archangium gephyra TaxID=48 RepID=A0AAC8QII7_9BACT|nr:Hypothetical protein AA314_09958 [Archangium gephyra]
MGARLGPGWRTLGLRVSNPGSGHPHPVPLPEGEGQVSQCPLESLSVRRRCRRRR